MPLRLSTPCRYITRRSVMTKWVVSQFRNGHSVSQPISTSQMAPMTQNTTCLAFASQVVPLTTAQPNDAAALARIRTTTGQNSRFQCGWRCRTTCSSPASTLSG